MIITKHSSEPYTSYVESDGFIENSGGPSRFDLPDVEELTLGVFSSFDDITYNTKPIIQAPEKSINSNKINTRHSLDNITDMFLTINREVRPLNIRNQSDDSSDDEWTALNSVLKYDNFQPSSLKKFKFNFDKKKYSEKNDIYPISANSMSPDSVENHAKIIREVLKKYPHLVQNNKNIRLKIMQKESKSIDCSTSGKTKVSYVLLKSDSLLDSDKLESFNSNKDHQSEISENGPWKCVKCDLNEQHTNYHLYRCHMQDVHGEKFDPRICEYCGYKASKRNILMYHMFTKHNVSPPKNMSFPKCDMCSYIALSESLLLRHQINHKHHSSISNSKFIPTDVIQYAHCNKNFPNTDEIMCHDITAGHETLSINKSKEHYCLYCNECFKSFNNLRSHVISYHKKLQKLEETTLMPALLESLSTPKNLKYKYRSTDNFPEKTEQKFIELEAKTSPKSQKNSTNFENPQTVVVINDEDHQTQTFEDEFPVNILSNNKLVVHNPDGNVIFCIQNTRHHNASQTLNTNEGMTDYQYTHNDAEIVEEVVEELESIEEEKQDQESNYVKYENLKLLQKEKKNIYYGENLFNTLNLTPPFTNTEEVIQYVEEETEILEYETCNV